MMGINDAANFIIQTIGSLYLFIVLMRFIMQLMLANFYNPLYELAVKATQPLLRPIRRVVPSLLGLDISSLVLALLLQILMFVVILILHGYQPITVLLLPWGLIGILSIFLKIIFWSIIISVILSWISPGSRSPGADLVAQITETVLAPLRRLVPNLAGLDISPILAFIAIQFMQSWLIPSLAFYTLMPKELFGAI